MFVCVHVCVCMSVCVHMFIYIDMFIYMYIRILMYFRSASSRVCHSQVLKLVQYVDIYTHINTHKHVYPQYFFTTLLQAILKLVVPYRARTIHIYTICMCVCVYVCIYMYACINIYACVCICIYMHACVYVYICMCVYMCLYAYIMHICSASSRVC